MSIWFCKFILKIIKKKIWDIHIFFFLWEKVNRHGGSLLRSLYSNEAALSLRSRRSGTKFVEPLMVHSLSTNVFQGASFGIEDIPSLVYRIDKFVKQESNYYNKIIVISFFVFLRFSSHTIFPTDIFHTLPFVLYK